MELFFHSDCLRWFFFALPFSESLHLCNEFSFSISIFSLIFFRFQSSVVDFQHASTGWHTADHALVSLSCARRLQFTVTTLALPAMPASNAIQSVAVHGSTIFYSDGEVLWSYNLATQQASYCLACCLCFS